MSELAKKCHQLLTRACTTPGSRTSRAHVPVRCCTRGRPAMSSCCTSSQQPTYGQCQSVLSTSALLVCAEHQVTKGCAESLSSLAPVIQPEGACFVLRFTMQGCGTQLGSLWFALDVSCGNQIIAIMMTQKLESSLNVQHDYELLCNRHYSMHHIIQTQHDGVSLAARQQWRQTCTS